MGIIIFNGISSQDFHIQVEHPPEYDAPEKDYDITHVPGRNGDIIIDKGSFKNTTRTYQIAIGSLQKEFAPMANSISEWLHSANNYARLEDTYEPEYYRLALYKDSLAVENILGHAARTKISFSCKPQRFLKHGDYPIKTTSSVSLHNPTNFKALPIITVNGNGGATLRIGDYTVIISNITGSLTINSEIQDIYRGIVNQNFVATLNNGFPQLVPGDNEISYSGGITSMEVIPKWWTL